ncbi:MAG: TlpA family protein disulfide reductase [Polyangiaceae bacterium]|nr:TlpA family protein disulfide reductase [Polyangiaceae bacterium]
MPKSTRSLYPDRSRGRRGALFTLIALASLGCGSSEPAVKTPPVPAAPKARGAPVAFELATIDNKPLSTATLAGRFSVIAFLATYDMASQAQARFIAELVRSHKPRINAAAIILELPENKPMVEAFVAALEPPYPVAMADRLTLAGEGPFRGLHHVPSVVILDREGREAFRRIGLTEVSTLEEVLRDIERTSPPAAVLSPKSTPQP